MLFAMWIEVHNDENDVVPRGGHFAIKQDCFVLRGVKSKVIVKLKSAVLLSDFVYPRDPVFNVSRRVPVAFLELVFLGVEVLFATWQSLVLAQLVSAINTVEG